MISINGSRSSSGTDPFGNAGTATIVVRLDSTPPTVAIETPAANALLTEPSLTVTGTVNDVVTGTVNGDDVAVTVNVEILPSGEHSRRGRAERVEG